MPDLTKLDNLSILKRLVNRVKNWRFQKSLPMTLFSENRIEQTLHELIRALKREELLPGT